MDIVIIGGGVIGASIAYWLADKSDMAVTVVEGNANFAQNGTASFASAGLLTPAAAIGTNPAITSLIKRGFDLYPELAANFARLTPNWPGPAISNLTNCGLPGPKPMPSNCANVRSGMSR